SQLSDKLDFAPVGLLVSTTMVSVGACITGVGVSLRLRSVRSTVRPGLSSDEPHPPYRRPALFEELLRNQQCDERNRIRPPEHMSQQGIELRTGTRVVALDVESLKVELADGEQLAYDQLLLATGGRPRELPQARGVPDVFTLRTINDVSALRDKLRPGSSLLVVGAGLIGAEVAATARGIGCAVMMLEAEQCPLSRLLPPQLAEVYTELHRSNSVDLHYGVQVASLERVDLGVLVTDTTGRKWIADTVLVAVGIAPNTELAEQAGLEIDAELGGIVVDEY